MTSSSTGSSSAIGIVPKAAEADLQFSKGDITWEQDPSAGGKFIGKVEVDFEGKTYIIRVSNIDDKASGGDILMAQAKRVLLLVVAVGGPIKVTGQNFEYMESGKTITNTDGINWTGDKSYISQSRDFKEISGTLEQSRAIIEKLQELTQGENTDKIAAGGKEMEKSVLRDLLLGTKDRPPIKWGDIVKDGQEILVDFFFGKSVDNPHDPDQFLERVFELLRQKLEECRGDMAQVGDLLKKTAERNKTNFEALQRLVSKPDLNTAVVKLHKRDEEKGKSLSPPAPKVSEESKSETESKTDSTSDGDSEDLEEKTSGKEEVSETTD